MSHIAKIIPEKRIILDPFQHLDGVKQFMDYFDIEPQNPGLLFLQKILTHYAQVPYENVSKVLKLNRDFTSPQHIRLPEEIIDDHIQYGLGGTCFSLTYYLQSILSIYDFHCYPVMADMKNRPNVHCALVVELDRKKYLVDPGYLLTQPMEINPDKPRLYRSPHTGVELRFDTRDERYHLYTFDRQNIKWRYTFKDRPTPADEFLQHWLASFYQGTMHGILLTRVQNDGLIYLHNNYLQISNIEGKTKKRLKENYPNIVQDLFGISADLIQEAEQAIARNMELEKKFGYFRQGKNNNETR